MYTHFKKKTTLASLYYLHNDIKDRKVIKHDIFYTFNLSQRKGTEIQGDSSEILAEVVGVLFISSRSAISCDFTYWDPALLFIPW